MPQQWHTAAGRCSASCPAVLACHRTHLGLDWRSLTTFVLGSIANVVAVHCQGMAMRVDRCCPMARGAGQQGSPGASRWLVVLRPVRRCCLTYSHNSRSCCWERGHFIGTELRRAVLSQVGTALTTVLTRRPGRHLTSKHALHLRCARVPRIAELTHPHTHCTTRFSGFTYVSRNSQHLITPVWLPSMRGTLAADSSPPYRTSHR